MSDPPVITFFIDRCFGTQTVAQALEEKGFSVEAHDNHFSQEAEDEAWLPKVGHNNNWVVLTKDARIGKRLTERLAVTNAQIKMFVLTSQTLSGEEMANAFIAALPAISNFLKRNQSPFIAKVHKNGRVSTWKNRENLIKELAYYDSADV